MAYTSPHRRLVRFLSCEELEVKLCLSAVSFDSHNISDDAPVAWSVYAADLDGDGDVDVLSASPVGGEIAWYENTDGNGGFGEQRVISKAAEGALSVYAADVDGDGDVDVISGSFTKTAWYENLDGKGTFGEQKILGRAASFSVFTADIDGDGDIDMLSTFGRDKIAWYENIDGNGSFGLEQVIATADDGPMRLHAADIDGDGDIDVLSAFEMGKITWYENTDGKGSFSDPQIINTVPLPFVMGVYTADVDGDGDVDVLSASNEWNRIAWYENTDGKGTFAPHYVLNTGEVGGIRSLDATDVDGDGDVDVVASSFRWSVSENFYDHKIAWYENTDGKGTFGREHAITTDVEFATLFVADIDGDGDTDIVSASYGDNRIAWHENVPLGPAAGDANGDFEFDQFDIVQVLQAAKYLTGQPATFEEGDWNFDGVFDQIDLIAALQTGYYLRGP